MTTPLFRVLLCLCLLLPVTSRAGESYSDLFVFGDSLSDTGNLAAFIDESLSLPVGTVGLCNPVEIVLGTGCADLFFQQSRVSNGPVAVEVLARRLGFDALQPSLYFLPPGDPRRAVGTNYAVAGATAGGSSLEDLTAQVGGFAGDFGAGAPDSALFVVMIGGNDIIDAGDAFATGLTDGTGYEAASDIVTGAVDAIERNLNALIGLGARHFVVANSVNVGGVPAARTAAEAAGIPPVLAFAVGTHFTQMFNRQLAERLHRIASQQPVEIENFDLFRSFRRIRVLAYFFGLNSVDGCFDTETYRNSPVAERRFHPDCAPDASGGAPDFDGFVFFDDLHPTGRVHDALGDALFRTVYH